MMNFYNIIRRKKRRRKKKKRRRKKKKKILKYQIKKLKMRKKP